MTIPLPFGYRRFEFKVLDGEVPERMAEPDKVNELMEQFYPSKAIPPAVRRRIYWHHSRTAERFQSGRVFLVGDAAHLQPPFFGQGMNSGIRDVTNLAWKLGIVLTGGAHASLLSSYDQERRPTARDMVKFATGVGKLYQPRNVVTERIRNFFFRGAQKVPGGRDYFLQMKYKPVPRYTEGFVLPSKAADKASLVGRAFPQPMVETLDGSRKLLDDVFGSRIAVVGLVPGTAEALSVGTTQRLANHAGVVVQAHVPASYRRSGQVDPAQRKSQGPLEIIDVYDFDGGLRDLLLARPIDQVYIIRPDRYVAAACSLVDLDRNLNDLMDVLNGGRSPIASAGIQN